MQDAGYTMHDARYYSRFDYVIHKALSLDNAPTLVQVCNLNPTFYIVEFAIACIQRYYRSTERSRRSPNKLMGSGYKPEPALR